MSQHDPLVALRHMLDHAREAVALARGHPRNGLDDNRVLQLALTRLVEIVGSEPRSSRCSFSRSGTSRRGQVEAVLQHAALSLAEA